MPAESIDYSTYQPDWWDGIGISAEAVKDAIDAAINGVGVNFQ